MIDIANPGGLSATWETAPSITSNDEVDKRLRRLVGEPAIIQKVSRDGIGDKSAPFGI